MASRRSASIRRQMRDLLSLVPPGAVDADPGARDAGRRGSNRHRRPAPRRRRLLLSLLLGGLPIPASSCSRADGVGLGAESNVPLEPRSSSAAPAAAGRLLEAPPAGSASEPLTARPLLLPQGGGPRAVRAEHGLVTSVEAQATEAGVRVLEAGGNAVDAAVAVGFALAVTHPSAGNLGGGGFLLVGSSELATVAIDFREDSPRSLNRDRFEATLADGGGGPQSVGLPGTVAGLLLAHERFGRLPRASVIQPALVLAREGQRVSPRTALTIAWNWSALARDPAAQAEFGPRGHPRRQGEQWVRPGLATTLERIARSGVQGFYEGPVADAIVARLGGSVSIEELRGYRARVREPLRFDYRGFTIETMPPPSAGGVALAVLLRQLEQQLAHHVPPDDPLAPHLFVEASRRAQWERRHRVIAPERFDPAELERRLTAWISAEPALPHLLPIDRARASPSTALTMPGGSSLAPGPRSAPEAEHTTHFAVVDRDGLTASCTTTLSDGYGAKLLVPGTGIVLNNSVGSFSLEGENLPEPGRRTVSSMAPTLVRAGPRLVLVLGSPGGDTIPSTIAQVLRNVLDRGMAIDRAIDTPRLHHGWQPDEVRFEAARAPPRDTLDALVAMGHRLSRKRIPMGDANSILLTEEAAWGCTDLREGGLTLAAKPSAADSLRPSPKH